MSVLYSNLRYMWTQVINPRIGDVYVFGGALDPNDTSVGTDCSGAVSAVNEALLYGPQMSWARQFWTGTFAGVQPGDRGPFGGADVTSQWICIASPDQAPVDAVMVVAVLQLQDPSQAHMVCRVQGVGIESGGGFTDANGNSTLHTGSVSTQVTDPMFNQFFYLPGPVIGGPSVLRPTPPQLAGDSTSQASLTVLAGQFL